MPMPFEQWMHRQKPKLKRDRSTPWTPLEGGFVAPDGRFWPPEIRVSAGRAALMCGTSREGILQAVRRGTLPGEKFDGRVYVEVVDVYNWFTEDRGGKPGRPIGS